MSSCPIPNSPATRLTAASTTTERQACERKNDFTCIECGMTDEEANAESSRCLRCDHFGYGIFKGGRKSTW